MIILPSPPRQAGLIGFGVVACVLGGFLWGILLSLIFRPHWFILGVIAASVLGLLGFLWPRALSMLYEAWNKLAYLFVRGARLAVMGVCFYVVLGTVGLAGSHLALSRPKAGQSLWTSRTTLLPEAYIHQYTIAKEEVTPKGWMGSYFLWVKHSRTLWASFLFPFLMLLWVLEPDQKRRLPPNIYTLF